MNSMLAEHPRSARFLVPLVLATIALGVAALFASCSDDDGGDRVTEAAVLEHLGERVILPAHKTFARDAEALARRAADFCSSAEGVQLAEVRDAWRLALASEQFVEIYNFGPWTAFPALLGSRINSWPATPANVEALLRSGEPITVDRLQAKGARERGLPVIEYLLHDGGGANGEEAPSDAELPDTPRCDYLVAATEDLRMQAELLLEAWSPDAGDYLGRLTHPDGSDMMFATTHDSLSELVNRMWFAIENVRRDSITRALGDKPANANPLAAEGARGDATYQTIQATLSAVEQLFLGTTPCPASGFEASRARGVDQSSEPQAASDEDERGCEPSAEAGTDPATPSIDLLLVQRGRADVVAAFEAELRGARQSVRDLAQSRWSSVVYQDRIGLATTSDELKDIQLVIQADIVNVLGLSIAFNDNDGD